MVKRTDLSKPWPPFPVDDLPEQVRGIVADWNRAPLQAHDLDGEYPSGYLVSIVVPCFNPNPDQFDQLIRSV